MPGMGPCKVTPPAAGVFNLGHMHDMGNLARSHVAE